MRLDFVDLIYLYHTQGSYFSIIGIIINPSTNRWSLIAKGFVNLLSVEIPVLERVSWMQAR